MAIDLKPLTNDVIHKMGYRTHDLWVVKVNDEVFGPFEVDSLRHYATENEELFEGAYASRMDSNDWREFYSYAQFQAITDHLHHEQEKRMYWILNMGQKTGPFLKHEIEKKIEQEVLSFNDLISFDDGYSWQKCYQLSAFSSHTSQPECLPQAPLNSSFEKAKEKLDQWLESHEKANTSQEALAAMAYLEQKSQRPLPKLDELDLKSLEQTDLARSLKWIIPTAVASLCSLFILGHYVLNSAPSELSFNETTPEIIMPKPIPQAAQAKRVPASYSPAQKSFRPQAHTQRPRIQHHEIPTPQETRQDNHDNYENENRDYDSGPVIEHVSENESPSQENSLVNQSNPEVDNNAALENGGEQSLDQAMLNQGQGHLQEQPVIEEVSDF